MIWAWVLKFFTGSWLKSIGKFISDNFKYIVVLVLVGFVFFCGKWYEQRNTEKMLQAAKTHYEGLEKQRTEEIERRVAAVEKDSTEKVKAAEKAKKAAEATANETEKRFKAQLKDRQIQLANAETRLQVLLSSGAKETDQAVIDANVEIAKLKMTYILSPLAVDTINKFVKDYK